MFTQQTRTERTLDRSALTAPRPLLDFIEAASTQIPGLSIETDAPSDPAGEWFVDLSLDGFRTQVAWRPSFGYGLFTSGVAYGDRPNEIFRTAELAARRLSQMYAQWQATEQVSPPWLMQLRQLVGTPQTELAAALSCNQPAVSRFEKRDDVKLSTLVSYLNAMGGRLDMRVHFDDLDVAIDLPAVAATPKRAGP
jgi:hypothetical protein